MRKSTVTGRAVPLTACSGDTSRKRPFLLHRTVVETHRISMVLRNACFDDEIAAGGVKMMNDGLVESHCATAIRTALGRKTERSSEARNTKHEAREIHEPGDDTTR